MANVRDENRRVYRGAVFGTGPAPAPDVSDEQTMPPSSGETEAPMRVIVCARGITLVGLGDVVVVRDVAELLIALDDQRRTTILVDVPRSPIDLAFIARLARDFPPTVAVIVQGEPHSDRRIFHDLGIYRAQFDPIDEGTLPNDGQPVERAALLDRVRNKLARQPTPLIAFKRR
jgi:hypothetical protein